MIKRIAIVPRSYVLAPPATGFVCLADLGPTHTLVKLNLPDGTVKDATTIADITFDGSGRQLDINTEALTALQRTAFKAVLTAAGITSNDIDATITDRKALAFVLLQKLAGRAGMNLEDVLWNHDAT